MASQEGKRVDCVSMGKGIVGSEGGDLLYPQMHDRDILYGFIICGGDYGRSIAAEN